MGMPILNLANIENFFERSIHLAGFLATIIGVISFLPIIYIVYKTKKTHNFPYNALVMALLGNLLWIFYAFYKDDKNIDSQVLFMGAIYFLLYGYIFYIKLTN